MGYEPITKGLRELMSYQAVVGTDTFKSRVAADPDAFDAACDDIDAIHRSLEAENERLRDASKRGDGWPLDADGVPICVGDMLANGEVSPEMVQALMFDRDGWSVNFGFGWCGMKYYEWHHAKPDTWESIISDAMRAGRADVAVDVMPLIKRCKALCERTREGEE